MPRQAFRDLYVDELRELWSAEQHLIVAFPRMARLATDSLVQAALRRQERQTEDHIKRLEGICHTLDRFPRGRQCLGIEALIVEGKDVMSRRLATDVMDAGIVAVAQRIEYYQIARYMTAADCAIAQRFPEQAAVLQRTVLEETLALDILTELASDLRATMEAEGRGANDDRRVEADDPRARDPNDRDRERHPDHEPNPDHQRDPDRERDPLDIEAPPRRGNPGDPRDLDPPDHRGALRGERALAGVDA